MRSVQIARFLAFELAFAALTYGAGVAGGLLKGGQPTTVFAMLSLVPVYQAWIVVGFTFAYGWRFYEDLFQKPHTIAGLITWIAVYALVVAAMFPADPSPRTGGLWMMGPLYVWLLLNWARDRDLRFAWRRDRNDGTRLL